MAVDFCDRNKSDSGAFQSDAIFAIRKIEFLALFHKFVQKQLRPVSIFLIAISFIAGGSDMHRLK